MTDVRYLPTALARASRIGEAHRPSSPTRIGRAARRQFRRYVTFGSLKNLFASRLYVDVVRPIMLPIRVAWCLGKFGREIARSGRPLLAQVRDMVRLAWRDGIDPILYPMLELYWPERRGWSDDALSRFEMGNGLLRRLHKLQSPRHGRRVNLGDKLAFHDCCRLQGLPSPTVVIHATGGGICWLEGPSSELLDRDLFMKPRQSRGARNALWLRRIAPFTWITQGGETWSLADLLSQLKRRSQRQDFLLQAMLLNHRDIADLADQSLIAIRVFTALDAAGEPIVTHAMLRILSKLEPHWHSKREHAVAIDLDTGRMGQMCNDKDLWPGSWTDEHPVTHARVKDRVLSSWPRVKTLAEAAHRVFADRMLVGWDIAVTPDGPVVLEGNSYPDVHFLQRVHQQPIGHSALGPLLQMSLDRLEIKDRHMTIASTGYF